MQDGARKRKSDKVQGRLLRVGLVIFKTCKFRHILFLNI